LGRYYKIYKKFEFVKPFYSNLIVSAADFLERYRDSWTGLPLESYDLWEERKGIFTFTVSAIYGGLQAAVLFARLFGDENKAR